MALTQLSNRKPGAYRVDIQLEAREAILPSSIMVTTWDFHGGRLLYTRDVWRYRVIAGTEDIHDFGHVDTEVMAIPAADLPMSNASQGTRVALVDHIAVSEPQGVGSPRVPEALAADPLTGNWILYSHREDVSAPYVTDLGAYTPGGSLLSSAAILQPEDIGLRWEVPHAVLYDNFLYAIERDFRPFPERSAVPGLVVRRQLGSVGSLTAWWSPEAEYIYPHSVSLSDEHVFVASTTLHNPGGFGTYKTSHLTWLSIGTLAEEQVRPLRFNTTDADFPTPYWLNNWEATGNRNTGGAVLFDRRSETFFGNGISPDGYNPDWWGGSWPTYALFEFAAVVAADPPFAHIADRGDRLPIPMYPTPEGLGGNDVQTLPELRAL